MKRSTSTLCLIALLLALATAPALDARARDDGHEAGAAFAALLLGILAIPWAGFTATAIGLAILQLAAVPAVVVALRRR